MRTKTDNLLATLIVLTSVFTLNLLIASEGFGQETSNIDEVFYPMINQRVTVLEARVKALEDRLKCPCPPGKCDCPDGVCPNCPTNNRKGGSNKITNNSGSWKTGNPKGVGKELLFFGADWCLNCGPAKDRIKEYQSDIYYVDLSTYSKLSDHPLANRYNVTGLPSVVKAFNGKRVIACEGVHVGKTIVGSWVSELSNNTIPVTTNSNPIPTTTRISNRSVRRLTSSRRTYPGSIHNHIQSHGISSAGWSQPELETIHDNLHATGRSGIVSSPKIINQPTTTYRPSVRYSSSFVPKVQYRTYSSCPSCR